MKHCCTNRRRKELCDENVILRLLLTQLENETDKYVLNIQMVDLLSN